MIVDPAAIAETLSPAQKAGLLRVSENEAISEADYLSLMKLGLINQPLAGHLPPTTGLGTFVLRCVAREVPLVHEQEKQSPQLKRVS